MIAFALRAEYEDTYLGGVLAVGNTSLDVKARLEEGDGTIVVSEADTMTLTVLDAYPALKRVPVPKDDPPPVTDRFEAMTVAELRDEAKTLGVDSPGKTRDEILANVRAAANPKPTQ